MIYADAANIDDLKRRRQQNEQDVIHLVQALRHNLSLENLHLRVALPPRAAGVEKDLIPYIDCPLITSLVSLVQSSATLKSLRLGLCRQTGLSQSTPDDRWYISAFATALSKRSSQTSQLHHLHLEAYPVDNTMEEQSALDAMGDNLHCLLSCEINYHKSAGGLEACISKAASWIAGRNTAKPRPPLCYRDKLAIFLRLNELGRKKLLMGPSLRKDWVDALVRSENDPSLIFHWLSMKPSLCGVSSS